MRSDGGITTGVVLDEADDNVDDAVYPTYIDAVYNDLYALFLIQIENLHRCTPSIG